MSRSLVAALILAVSANAACSGSEPHAAALADGGAGSAADAGRSSAGGSAGRSEPLGEGGMPLAGEAGESSADRAAGAAGEEQGSVVDVPPSDCTETSLWADGQPLSGISTRARERLLSITPDELDIVFMRDEQLLSAHRDAATDDFGAGTELTLPDGFDANPGLALSADGTQVILLSSDSQMFARLTRASRREAFSDTADSEPFAELNQRAQQTLEHYAAPVLAPDGTFLLFTGFTPEPAQGFPDGVTGVSVLYTASYSGDHYIMPHSISTDLFDGTSAARPLASGIAADGRTVFYFDEGSSTELARYRDRPDAPLYTVRDLGQRVGATPATSCGRLYYTSQGDVVVGSL